MNLFGGRVVGDGSTFLVDMLALLIVGLSMGAIYVLWHWRRNFAEPQLFFSDVNSLAPENESWRVRLAFWPSRLLWMGLFAFLAAFVDPHVFIKKELSPENDFEGRRNQLPTEGIAIYLVLDQSGSMGEEVSVGRRKSMTKMQLLKQVTKQFVAGDSDLGLAGRPNDMIGLISFARGAQVLAPLTLDHQAILNQLSQLQLVGSRDQDGTAIGYGIFKAASLIAATRHYSQELIEKGEPAYTIKNSVIILITDGLQDPNPLDSGKRLRNIDIPGAAVYAKQQGVRLYIVNVEPKINLEQFAPNRHQMQRAAELTGGKLFIVDSTTDLAGIYHEIDQLEKSQLPQPQEFSKADRPDIYRRFSFYPYLIGLGLMFLFGAVMLESTLVKRLP